VEMTMTGGSPCCSRYGLLAVSGGIGSKRLRAVLSGAPWPFAGRPFHPAPINPTGIDLPTTDRMRMSASEP
jgi:hypothetical protein